MKPKTDLARSDLAVLMPVLLVTYALYAQRMGHGFLVMDDPEYVAQNPYVLRGLTLEGARWAATTFHAGNWHPLTWVSHMLDVELFGLHARSHHLMSLLYHLANTALLFLYLRLATGQRLLAGWAALFFAIHPLHVESVAWIAERKDVLSTFFLLLCLLTYHFHVSRRSKWAYPTLIALFALGLAAKPMVVTLPFLLLLLDYWPYGRLQYRDCERVGNAFGGPVTVLLLEKSPLFLLSAGSAVVTLAGQHSEGAMVSLHAISLADRVGNALYAYLWYLWKTVVPFSLTCFYPYQERSASQVLLALLVLSVVTLLVFQNRERHPPLLVGWLWYLGSLVPVIGLVQVGAQAAADRYTYIPLVGPFMAVGYALSLPVTHDVRRLVYAAAALFSLLLATQTFLQVGYWRDSVVLFRHALAVTERNDFAHVNLAAALEQRGQLAEAAEQAQAALAIRPGHPAAHMTLGNIYLRQGNAQRAAQEFAAAVKPGPTRIKALNNLGIALLLLGDEQAATASFREALALDDTFADAHFNLGRALEGQEKLEEACAQYRRVLELKPWDTDAHLALGRTLARLGRRQAGQSDSPRATACFW